MNKCMLVVVLGIGIEGSSISLFMSLINATKLTLI